jgi:hypothetical protein
VSARQVRELLEKGLRDQEQGREPKPKSRPLSIVKAEAVR